MLLFFKLDSLVKFSWLPSVTTATYSLITFGEGLITLAGCGIDTGLMFAEQILEKAKLYACLSIFSKELFN